MMMSDESSDLSAAATGDREAFARLYDRHAGIVLSLCRRRSWSLEEAEDAAQETFLRVYPILDRFDALPRFRAWLYRATGRVCSERRRAAKRRRRWEMTAADRQMESQPPEPTPVESAEHVEQLERLTGALDALPHKERLALHLYYLDDDPATTAAEFLKLSRPGFYKLLGRARRHLVVLMGEGQPA
ncbi:MAG TPA: sigma-70 family RNA polymerase sigma factor [Phycisphaerae bacterium]|nr:sigma-70 family RNA polymerase sigma factor [Phycisphaerae bacterium]